MDWTELALLRSSAKQSLRMVHASPPKPAADRKTVDRCLDELGAEPCKQIKLVSCDMAS
jgi:hypothetical protein